jgi:hypothetical protein
MASSIMSDVQSQAASTQSFIQQKWGDASDKADQAFNAALDAIQDIVNLGLPSIAHPNVAWEDIVADFSISVTKPDLPDITYTWPDTRPVIGALREYPQFDFPLSDYNALNNETIAAIRAKLTAGGTGIGADAEAALWARMRARNDFKNETAYQETLNFFISRGFDLPTGALSGRLLQIQTEILRSEVDTNNDITVEQARLTLDNEKFIYELALRTAIDYQKNSVEIIATQNKNVIDTYIAGLEAYKTDVTAEATRVESLSKITIALLEGYKAEVEAEGTVVDAKAKEIDAKIRLQLGKAEVTLKITDIDIEVAKFVWSAQVEMYKTIASVASQLAASALTSVNASVSSGFSGSAGESISGNESYSYDQTKDTRTVGEQHIYSYDGT